MINKKLIQLFLLLLIFVISVIFYFTYFVNTSKNSSVGSIDQKLSDDEYNEEISTIEDIEYISEDNNGNKYIIRAKYADIDEKDSDKIDLRFVEANIELNNKSTIFITSENAIYNNINYDTEFYSKVLLKYENHTINSNNLDLKFEKNLVTVYNNIVYKGLTTKLKADKI